MKINLQSDQESTSSGIEVQQMSFDTRKQAKLFHMLSSSLYSNKPASIIRELCSNCHDSHVMAGKTHVPFELIGPTFEHPQLVVRDFGVGLTAEEAVETILMYLGSNKDHSDDFIGGYGIGSKSPFAYAKNYQVVVIKNGMRAEFACWKDEHGLPAQALISHEATDLPNGVEMIVPVEPEDIQRFTDAVDDYMKWTNYNVKTTNGGRELLRRQAVETIPSEAYTMELFENGDGSIRLVYGGYSYKMEEALDDRFDYSSDWKKMVEASSKQYDIAVLIHKPGSLDFNMNREELEQTDKTRAFVRAVVSYVSGEGQKHANSYTNEIDAWKLEMKATAADAALPRKTLADVATMIDKALSKGAETDRFFGKAFRIFDQKFRYDLRATAHHCTLHSGVGRIHGLDLVMAELHTQYMFVYGRIMGLQHSQRRQVMAKVSPGLRVIYVKAETRDDFDKWIAAHPDFCDLDISKFKVEFVDFPKSTPAARSYDPRAATPRIYCATQKCYHKFNMHFEYLVATAEEIEEMPALLKFIRAVPAPRRRKPAIQLFTPTYDFKKRYFDKTTNEWELSCVKTIDRFIAEHLEKAEATVTGVAGLQGKRLYQMETLLDSLDDFSDLPEKLQDRVTTFIAEHRPRVDLAKEVRNAIGAEAFMARGKGTVSAVLNTGSQILREAKRVSVVTRFLRVDTIEKYLSYSRFERDRPAAWAMVEAAGLTEYFRNPFESEVKAESV